MIRKELFDLYETYHNGKKRIANKEMEQIKRKLTDMNLEPHINYIQVNIGYEENVFDNTNSVTVKYDFELDNISTIDYNTVNTIDNYLIRKYGKENIRIRDIRMHLDYTSFEYFIRLDKEENI